jgi:hypothetical protein
VRERARRGRDCGGRSGASAPGARRPPRPGPREKAAPRGPGAVPRGKGTLRPRRAPQDAHPLDPRASLAAAARVVRPLRRGGAGGGGGGGPVAPNSAHSSRGSGTLIAADARASTPRYRRASAAWSAVAGSNGRSASASDAPRSHASALRRRSPGTASGGCSGAGAGERAGGGACRAAPAAPAAAPRGGAPEAGGGRAARPRLPPPPGCAVSRRAISYCRTRSATKCMNPRMRSLYTCCAPPAAAAPACQPTAPPPAAAHAGGAAPAPAPPAADARQSEAHSASDVSSPTPPRATMAP